MNKVQLQMIDLSKALNKLKEACKLKATLINQDATIQRFEFTFELTWKTLQSIVRANGVDVYGPKNVLREAYKLGLISELEKWFSFLEARNLTAHTYNEQSAQKVYNIAKKFSLFVNKLLQKINESNKI